MRFCCFVLVLLVGCASPQEEPVTATVSSPPPSPTTSTGPAANDVETPSRPPATPAPAEANITIDRVEIANPIVITGTARTFENNVALRVVDAKGAVIAEDFATATGEMGTHSPYRGTVWITRDPGPRVTVQALEYSAKDGSEQSVVSVERPFGVEMIEVYLTLATPDCNGTVVEKQRIPKSVSHARLLVETLMRSRKTPFPQGSRVRSINLRDGVLTVDFNERLQNVGGACRAGMIREMVTKTLMRVPNVKRVVITAAGSEALALQP